MSYTVSELHTDIEVGLVCVWMCVCDDGVWRSHGICFIKWSMKNDKLSSKCFIYELHWNSQNCQIRSSLGPSIFREVPIILIYKSPLIHFFNYLKWLWNVNALIKFGLHIILGFIYKTKILTLRKSELEHSHWGDKRTPNKSESIKDFSFLFSVFGFKFLTLSIL